jgi:hypothetical protein
MKGETNGLVRILYLQKRKQLPPVCFYLNAFWNRAPCIPYQNIRHFIQKDGNIENDR